jgi:anti-sigma-K factor RskA
MSEPDDVRALLGAYALDAVDDAERQAVDELVARDPAAAAELDSLRAVAARLAAATPADPPAALRETVLAAVAATPQARRRRRPRARGRARADTPDVLGGAVPDWPSTGVTDPATDVPGGGEPGPGSDVLGADVTSPDDVTGLAERGPAPVQEMPPRPRTRPAQKRSGARWWALAAAVAIGAAVPGAVAVQQAQRAREAEQQQEALADLLTDPSAVVVHGTATGGDGTATAVLTDDRALFSASGLPPLDAGQVYQLWVVDADGAASSAGVMVWDDGTVRQLADGFAAGDTLAMTVEPAGGSEQPTTTPLVTLTAA